MPGLAGDHSARDSVITFEASKTITGKVESGKLLLTVEPKSVTVESLEP